MRMRSLPLCLFLVMAAVTPGSVRGQDSTPAPPGTSSIPRVKDYREIAVEGRIISMSPDGSWLATYDNDADTLCSYAVAASERTHACAALDENEVGSVAYE